MTVNSKLYRGDKPFPGVRDCDIVIKVWKGVCPPHPMEGGGTMPEDMWALANECWKELPSRRPSITEVE